MSFQYNFATYAFVHFTLFVSYAAIPRCYATTIFNSPYDVQGPLSTKLLHRRVDGSNSTLACSDYCKVTCICPGNSSQPFPSLRVFVATIVVSIVDTEAYVAAINEKKYARKDRARKACSEAANKMNKLLGI